MLTSDKLSALDNMSMRMVNGDFKSCKKNENKNKKRDKKRQVSINEMQKSN